MPSEIGVVGAGGWGTALAKVLADKGEHVALWCHGNDSFREIVEARENRTYLPGIQLPGNIRATQSLDATIEAVTSSQANTANTIETPGRAVMHVGGRYRFTLFGKPATVRVLVQNVTDKYGWIAVSSGTYIYNAPRRFTVYVTADL